MVSVVVIVFFLSSCFPSGAGWPAWGQAAARLHERASCNRCDWGRARDGTRCCTAGPWASGLLAREPLPGTGEAGLRPGEPAHRRRCRGGAHQR